MGMHLSCGLSQQLASIQTLSQVFGDSSGDIPVYSLHRISRLLRTKPMAVSPQLGLLIKRSLISANQIYKEESGNDWSCLTSSNLVEVINELENEIKVINEAGVASIPKEFRVQIKVSREFFDKKRAECIIVVKKWFEENYNALLYDMNGKIPWPVIQRLRRNLGVWILGVTNPFDQDIGEMICEVATDAGITTDNPEDAWEAMGGKLFTKED